MKITHTTPPFKLLQHWEVNDVVLAMLAKTEQGGIGFSTETVETLAKLELRGTTILSIIENSIETHSDFDCLYISQWFKKRLNCEENITASIPVLDWFTFTGVFESESLPILLDEIVALIDVEFKEEVYQAKVQRDISEINRCMGKFGVKGAEWPVVAYDATVRLDWRFSTHILPSTEEFRTIQQLRNENLSSPLGCNESEPSISSINEYIADEICRNDESKIYVLLALSGAGKTHSLFYLNTSNSAFTLPIDFGSIEDSSVLLDQSMDYIRIQVKRLKPNKDFNNEIENGNKECVNNIQAEIATLFSLRGLMLLHLLRKRKQNLTPSMWIRFLYSDGSSKYKSLYSKWKDRLRTLNKDAMFLKLLIAQLDIELSNNSNCKCKRVVLTVDEINPLVRLGYGDNRISINTDIASGSVASILFSLLEDCSSTSVVSGTRIETNAIRLTVPNTLKNRISLFPYYGSTKLKELCQFTNKYFHIPDTQFYSNHLLKACCTILQGRRRAFMKFMSNIVGNVQRYPYPEDENEIESWRQKIILDSFSRHPPNEFHKDIKNFLSETYGDYEANALEKTKIDVSLYLVLKNSLKISDLDKIIESHFGSSQPQLRDKLIISLIYHGISFASFDNSGFLFQSTEIVNSIYLNSLLRNKFERAKELVSIWLQAALENQEKESHVLKKLFEMIGAMILLLDVGKSLQGNPITTHELFKEEANTFLANYTLPSSLSIINNKNYWKFPKGRFSFYRDVVVFGLEEGLNVNVKTLLIPISKQSSHVDLPVRELNMTCRFITNPEHDTEFSNDFIDSDSNLRIVFEYSFENIQLFSQFKTRETENPILLFNKTNEVFINYFKETFPLIYSILNEFNY